MATRTRPMCRVCNERQAMVAGQMCRSCGKAAQNGETAPAPEPTALEIVPRTLETLAGEINAGHAEVEAGLLTTLERAREVGELLAEAKERVEHGQWLVWLDNNVTFSIRTAQNYMRLADKWEELEANTQHVAYLPYRGAMILLSDHIEPEEVTPESSGPSAHPTESADPDAPHAFDPGEREPDPADPPPGKGEAWEPEEDGAAEFTASEADSVPSKPGPKPLEGDEYLRDGIGLAVPERLARVFEGAAEVEAAAVALDLARRRVASAVATRAGEDLKRLLCEPELGHPHRPPLEPLAEPLRRAAEAAGGAVPYVSACVHCHCEAGPGQTRPDCKLCRGRGWMTERAWASARPDHRERFLAEVRARGLVGRPWQSPRREASRYVKAREEFGAMCLHMDREVYARHEAALMALRDDLDRSEVA